MEDMINKSIDAFAIGDDFVTLISAGSEEIKIPVWMIKQICVKLFTVGGHELR